MTPERLKILRVARGFTQARLAQAAGLNKRTVSRMERGSPVQSESLIAVCSVLGVEPSEARPEPREAARPDVAVVAADNPSVSRHLVGEALSALAEYPDVAALALPDLAAWRASRRPPRGSDLNRAVFSPHADTWEALGRFGFMAGFLLMLAGVPASVLLSKLTPAPWGMAAGVVVLIVCMAPLAVIPFLVLFVGDPRIANAFVEERLGRTLWAFSDGCVREIVVGADAVTVRRFDLSGRIDLRRRAVEGRVDYDLDTAEGSLRILAVPIDPRIEGIMLTDDPGAIVRRLARTSTPAPSALAAAA